MPPFVMCHEIPPETLMWVAIALFGCIETVPQQELDVGRVVTELPMIDVEVEADVLPRSDHPLCQALERASSAAGQGVWNGSSMTCQPGSPPQDDLPLLALVRELAGLPAVKMSSGSNAQACALVMDANDAISHYPTEEWSCVTPTIATTAASSLLATVPVDRSIKAFMIDPGNELSFGHRRWLLSNWLETIEFGSTDTYTCLELTEFSLDHEGPVWTAWPPPGETPRQLLELYGYTTDEVGWTVQSDSIDLSEARVSVWVDGAVYVPPVTLLVEGLGSNYALSFPVSGMPRSDHYRVEVWGVPEPFSYEVDLLDCDVP